jgi:hypothetical protein
MTVRQRTLRIAYWRGSAITFLVVAIFFLLQAATDAIQQL